MPQTSDRARICQVLVCICDIDACMHSPAFCNLLTFRIPHRQCRTRTWHLHLIFLTLVLLV